MSEITITKEMLEKAKEAKSAEELMALARENGIDLPEEKAEEVYRKLSAELSDEELDNVAGGVSMGGQMTGRTVDLSDVC